MARPSPHQPLPSECVGAGEADRARRVPWDGGARGDRRMTQARGIAIGPEAQLSSADRHGWRSRTWLNSLSAPAGAVRTHAPIAPSAGDDLPRGGVFEVRHRLIIIVARDLQAGLRRRAFRAWWYRSHCGVRSGAG